MSEGMRVRTSLATIIYWLGLFLTCLLAISSPRCFATQPDLPNSDQSRLRTLRVERLPGKPGDIQATMSSFLPGSPLASFAPEIVATAETPAPPQNVSPVASDAPMSAQDVVAALGGLREGERYNAITALARNGQIRSPLSAIEGASILQGTTQVARAAAIGEMAQVFKTDLTGQEAAAILGPAKDLSEGNRYNAISTLARAKRFGPSLGGDAGFALDGTTQASRAAAIGEIAPYLRTDMRGQQAAAILGSEQILREGNRYNAIAALARAGRVPQSLSAAEAVPILAGTTQAARAAAIGEMAQFFITSLSGDDTAAILGGNGETTEGNRYNAIAALARAGKLRPGFSGQEMALVLQGMSGQARAAAIGEIASASARPMAATPAAQSGPQPVSRDPTATNATSPAGASAVTAASIDARIARLRDRASMQLPYLYESTGTWSDISIVARDLPAQVLGFTDYRALSDQLYFSAIQYVGLANRWIRQAQVAKANGDLGSATRCLDHATTLLRQRLSSYAAAQAVADQDLARATTYVRATYETSKWAAGIVAGAAGIPGGSVMIDAAGGFIDFALNVQDRGMGAASGQALADAVTYAIINKMPIPALDGRTLDDAIKNRAGKLLADAEVISALRDGIKSAAIRKVVVDGAKSLLSMPAEDQINAALNRLLAVDLTKF